MFRESWPTPANRTCSSRTVAYGFFPANGDGTTWSIWTDENRNVERARFPLPRQTKSPYLCIADFFRSVDSGEPDYVAAQIATMGSKVSERTAELFAADKYTEYLFLHGLGVEMAESLAERTGTAASARSGDSLTRIPPGPTRPTPDRTVLSTGCSARSTAAAATPSDIRRAPTSRTTQIRR
jgi:5-methyltetrahydrofolate--homocysteine methyltransferase